MSTKRPHASVSPLAFGFAVADALFRLEWLIELAIPGRRVHAPDEKYSGKCSMILAPEIKAERDTLLQCALRAIEDGTLQSATFLYQVAATWRGGAPKEEGLTPGEPNTAPAQVKKPGGPYPTMTTEPATVYYTTRGAFQAWLEPRGLTLAPTHWERPLPPLERAIVETVREAGVISREDLIQALMNGGVVSVDSEPRSIDRAIRVLRGRGIVAHQKHLPNRGYHLIQEPPEQVK